MKLEILRRVEEMSSDEDSSDEGNEIGDTDQLAGVIPKVVDGEESSDEDENRAKV